MSVVSVRRPLSCHAGVVTLLPEVCGWGGVRRLPSQSPHADSNRISQLSYVTVASRDRPNFARISRKTRQPNFRKTLRETLT